MKLVTMPGAPSSVLCLIFSALRFLKRLLLFLRSDAADPQSLSLSLLLVVVMLSRNTMLEACSQRALAF